MPIRGASSGGGGGASILDDLLDVIISGPVANDLLYYSGGQWINAPYAHNNLSGLTIGDPHPQYLYLSGRVGGQTLLSTAAGDTNLIIKAFASSTGESFSFQSSGGVDLIDFRRVDNAGGGDVGLLDIVTPAGKNSGAVQFWVAGQTPSQRAAGSGKFAQQYYNATDDAYYVGVWNGTAARIIFLNASASGSPTFCLDPTDKGRFGVNTNAPGYTLDVWYNGASILHVTNVGGIVAATLNTSGNILATGAISTENSFNVNNGGVACLRLSTDGFNDYLDITQPLQVRDTIGGGGATVASLTKTGRLRLGDGTAAVHRLELVAGTAAIAPKRSFAGVNLTVQTDGVEEYDGTHFYLSPAAVRQRIALMPAVRGIASFRV